MSWFGRKKERDGLLDEVAVKALDALDAMDRMEPVAKAMMEETLKGWKWGQGPEFQRGVLKRVKSQSVEKARTLARLWGLVDFEEFRY